MHGSRFDVTGDFLRRCIMLCGVLAAGQVQAGLIGDTVSVAFVSGDASATEVVDAIVGDGEDGNLFGNQLFDFGEASFALRSDSDYCGIWSCTLTDTVSLVLGGLDLGASIVNVEFESLLSGVTVAFTADSATFTWHEQTLPEATYLSVRFLTGPTVSGATVPEPASFALSGTALALLAWRRRRAPAVPRA